MSVTGYNAVIDFAPALGPSGLFAVRDGSTNTPVVSRLVVAGAPSFGAEPSSGNWPITGKVLFYGVKLSVANLAKETPAGDVFELTTLPSGLTFNPAIRTGVCELDDPNAQILHKHSGDPAVILRSGGAAELLPRADRRSAGDVELCPGRAPGGRLAGAAAGARVEPGDAGVRRRRRRSRDRPERDRPRVVHLDGRVGRATAKHQAQRRARSSLRP